MSACTRRITSWRPLPRFPVHHRTPSTVNLHHTAKQRRTTLLLQSREQSKIWHVDSLSRQNEVSLSSSGEDGEEDARVAGAAAGMLPLAAENVQTREDPVDEKIVVDAGRDKRMEVLVAAAATVVLGVGNRVLYKLALVPLKKYPFFLAQFATFGYVLVYFSILYARRKAGVVTDEMLSLPKAPFLAVGLLEALGAASGMAAGTMLSGASIPILSQTFLIWQLILSAIFLGRRYSVNQLFGCFLVAAGVVVTVASGSSAGLSLKEAGVFWSLLMVVSFLLQAADTVLKEIIFLDASKRLKGGSVDLFVVNSFGSAFQAFFICLLLPFMSKMWGIPFSQLPSYLMDGAACFLNINTLSTGCEGAPLLPLLFVIVNMGFNISLLHLLKVSSAVVSCLASTFSEQRKGGGTGIRSMGSEGSSRRRWRVHGLLGCIHESAGKEEASKGGNPAGGPQRRPRPLCWTSKCSSYHEAQTKHAHHHHHHRPHRSHPKAPPFDPSANKEDPNKEVTMAGWLVRDE